MKKFRRRSARMNLMHYRVLVRRYFKQIFTSLGTLLPLLLQAPVMLLIVYLVCQREAFTMKTPEFLTGANVILFMLVVMSALMGILNSYREICKEREVLSREVFGGLDISAYVLSKFSVLAAVGLFQCALLFGGSLLFIDFSYPHPATGYICSFAAMALTNISTMAIGLFISALLKKSESAILPVLFIIIEHWYSATACSPSKGARARYATSPPAPGASPCSETQRGSTIGRPRSSTKICSPCIRS